MLTLNTPLVIPAAPSPLSHSSATTSQWASGEAYSRISDRNHNQSFAFYRFWFDIVQAHSEVTLDQILDGIWDNRGMSVINPGYAKLILLTAALVLHFMSDVEWDSIPTPHGIGLRIRLNTRFPNEFFEGSMVHIEYDGRNRLGDSLSPTQIPSYIW